MKKAYWLNRTLATLQAFEHTKHISIVLVRCVAQPPAAF